MRRELVNRQREEQAEAEVDEKADIDSVDSPICACGSPMLMQFLLRGTRGDYESILSEEDDLESGEDERRFRAMEKD
jgi:hypothetical protein